jgi:2-methylcitrate dehydratase PrpD
MNDLPQGAAALSAYIASRATEDFLARVPDLALRAVRIGIADCLGVMVAGRQEPASQIIRQVIAAGPAGHEARMLPEGTPCSARDAALANGVAAHVLDYDDVALDGHPTAVLLPAILAEAEFLGADCGQLLGAYVAGYESWALLRGTAAAALHSRGWHPSSVFGSIATAVACARLRRLDATQTCHAMGLAAAQAGGLMANFGTMAKSFQTARAAEAGLLAARLAQAGMTARTDLFDGGGEFARIFAGGSRDMSVAAFGDPGWALIEDPISIKLYPVCYASHRLIDAALALHATGGFALGDITRIEAHIGAVPSGILYATWPADTLAAKFCAEFVIAAAIRFGAVGSAELELPRRADPELTALLPRVTRITTDAVGDNPPHAPFDFVALHLADGRVVRSPHIHYPSGSPQHQVTTAQALEKFTETTAGYFMQAAAAEWFRRLMAMTPSTPLAEIMPPALGRI